MSKKRVLTVGNKTIKNFRNKPVKAVRKMQRKAKQSAQHLR